MNTSAVLEPVRAQRQTNLEVKTLIPFLALSFGISWGAIALLILFADQITAIFGEISSSNPLFILAVYAPGLAGIFLVWRHYGRRGLGSLFRRLTLWRAPALWWLFLLFGIPAIVYAAAAVKGTINDPFPFSPWYLVLPALVQSLFLGPVGEEFGWRGLALPLLQRKFSPFWASLILGVIWAIWHAPAFVLSGTPQSAWSFGPFFLGLVAITVILTPLFNASGGSLLIAILYHLHMMNPIFPDAQPWDNVLFAIAAVIIVWLNRDTMFKRGNGVTDVLRTDDR
ncbi:MAG TPA: type II CAAX endopeptidase family protein [Anaerolineales bacterium]|nr:type II CAAX endopeptidase family protein [Anaerolineales bacterium]